MTETEKANIIAKGRAIGVLTSALAFGVLGVLVGKSVGKGSGLNMAIGGLTGALVGPAVSALLASALPPTPEPKV